MTADGPAPGDSTAPPPARSPYSFTRAVTVGGAGFAVGLLPMFLTGALGVQLTSELSFGTFGLGAAIAVHRAASALTSIPAGRLADRFGGSRSLRIGAGLAGVASLGVSLIARNWLTLALCLAAAGAAMALAEPAANRLLVTTVSAQRLGRAFGLKQSAAPAATMLAGLCVPWIALRFGWRWTFVVSGVLALAVVLSVPRAVRRQAPAQARPRRVRLRAPLLILSLAAALGLSSASSSTVSSFYVVAAESAGGGVRTAGTFLALASLTTIVTRMIVGVIADRLPANHLRISAVGQLVGCAGFALLATAHPAIMAVGVIVALAGTWGFHGLSWFAMVRGFPHAPGTVTGAIAPGALIGGVLGPLIVGSISASLGYRSGWVAGASMALLAAVTMMYANRRLRATSTG